MKMKMKYFVRDHDPDVVSSNFVTVFSVCVVTCNDENREISSVDIYHKMAFLSFKNQEMWNLECKR